MLHVKLNFRKLSSGTGILEIVAVTLAVAARRGGPPDGEPPYE